MNLEDILKMRREMESMPHDSLYQMRSRLPDREMQRAVAPYEHRAFAREWTQENPLNALALIPAIPGYQLYKMFTDESRSGVDFNQIGQGYMGMGEGLGGWLSNLFQ